jgi:flavodoxin
MYSVLILWAPETAENRRIAELIARAFEEAKVECMAKKVTETTIADINAARIVVFGTQKSNGAEVPPDYAECLRFFRGVTFAGRTAGFFSMGAEKATGKLRKALKDTEIAQLEDDPLFSEQKPNLTAEIAAWTAQLLRVHQESHYGRT